MHHIGRHGVAQLNQSGEITMLKLAEIKFPITFESRGVEELQK